MILAHDTPDHKIVNSWPDFDAENNRAVIQIVHVRFAAHGAVFLRVLSPNSRQRIH